MDKKKTVIGSLASQTLTIKGCESLASETKSSDPIGCYLRTALEHHLDGITTIQYLRDNSVEQANLHSVYWEFTHKNFKKFIPIDFIIKKLPLKRVRDEAAKCKFTLSKNHWVKAFVNDLSLINSSFSDHQKNLLEIDAKCGELGLMVRPVKCVSMSFDRSRMKSYHFTLSAGSQPLFLPKFLVKLWIKTSCPLRKLP